MPTNDPVNLILVYMPNGLDVKDFEQIAQRVKDIADNINVIVRQDTQPEQGELAHLAEHRTFVFSPMQLKNFYLNRGCVCAGRPMQKSEQLLRLQLAGVPVPEWTSLDRGKLFDPDYWGEYVVVKPEMGSLGRGVVIKKTAELNSRTAQLKPFAREGSNFIVQKLIRNQHSGKIRIQILFNEVLYARLYRFSEELRFDTVADMQKYQQLFKSDWDKSEEYDSEEVFSLAKKCISAYDGVPMLGLDVLLDEQGKPYFIEANPGGNTWHFSSAIRGRSLRQNGIYLENQFNAFVLAGEVLAKKAIELAV